MVRFLIIYESLLLYRWSDIAIFEVVRVVPLTDFSSVIYVLLFSKGQPRGFGYPYL